MLVNTLNYETKTYFSDYLQSDIYIAYGWEKVLQGELSDSQKVWFKQLVESELRKQGEPYRTIEDIDSNGMITYKPPGANDKDQHNQEVFRILNPNFKEEN